MKLSTIIKQYRKIHRLSGQQFAEKCGLTKGYISQIENEVRGKSNPRIDSLAKLAKGMGISLHDLMSQMDEDAMIDIAEEHDDESSNIVPAPDFLMTTVISIPVYGTVPAGVPIEAIQDIDGYVDIPADWTTHGKYIGLKVSGSSMYPKYLEGDTIVIKLQPEVASGQDAVVYVNGYDATLKTVINEPDGSTTLHPINPEYQTKTYDPGIVRVLGVVKRLVREI